MIFIQLKIKTHKMIYCFFLLNPIQYFSLILNHDANKT